MNILTTLVKEYNLPKVRDFDPILIIFQPLEWK